MMNFFTNMLLVLTFLVAVLFANILLSVIGNFVAPRDPFFLMMLVPLL